MDEVKVEKEKLESVIKLINEVIDDSKLELENVYNLYSNKDDAEIKKHEIKNRINILSNTKDKPYFARIDFKNDKDNITDICYIGKVGVQDYDNNIITVDWRAPISTLYYDSNIGNCSYNVEDEIIKGNLKLKRQYNIENQTLISFDDVDTVSNDELLKPYLSVSADSRLKNIVSTIQSEQNEIIRSSIGKNLIIEGVAGSGKTTVALHRIAYISYTYKDIIKNNQYMVIGPNKFFINYISSVLPDLDVHDIKQYDLSEFTKYYLGEDIKVSDDYTSISKYKTSMEFKKYIDSYFIEYSSNLIKYDLKIKDIVIINKNIIADYWSNLKIEDSIKERIDKTILLLDKYLSSNKEKIIIKINKYYDDLLGTLNLENVRKLRTATLKELNEGSIIKKYFNKLISKTTLVYKDILSNLKIDDYKFDNKLYYEDLTPLLYVCYKLNGSSDYYNIKHVVIDEAQDYNELMFYTLKRIMKNSTFSIYGDIAQSLYPYRSIDSFNDLKKLFNDIEIKHLSKSYRTSIEIMNEANKINRHLNLIEANAVIRHSDKVLYKKITDKINDICDILNSYIDKSLKSIAIISKTNNEGLGIYNILKDKFNINFIDEDNTKYIGGICIISSKLSKGLEFDGVIITDVSNFNINNTLDMKLLYVSMTRAMHNLSILYQEKLCSILK